MWEKFGRTGDEQEERSMSQIETVRETTGRRSR